jgi:hypothetical protein
MLLTYIFFSLSLILLAIVGFYAAKEAMKSQEMALEQVRLANFTDILLDIWL